LPIAVFVLGREQGHFRGSIEGARREQGEARREQGEHEGSTREQA